MMKVGAALGSGYVMVVGVHFSFCWVMCLESQHMAEVAQKASIANNDCESIKTERLLINCCSK